MQTSSPLFPEQDSFAQAAKTSLKQIDIDALLKSPFCKKLLESFVFLLTQSLPISFIDAMRDFPKHVKNCIDAYVCAATPDNSLWEKIQFFLKIFGMFFYPLGALCGSIISFIALIMLSIVTTIAMFAAALTKAFIDILSHILRFDLKKDFFSFFFKLSQNILFKTPYEFLKASFSKIRSWLSPAPAETANSEPHFEFDFFKFALFLFQQGSLKELFSIMESIQASLAAEGLKMKDVFQGEHQAKAIFAAIEQLSRQGFATQDNPALQTIVQAVDIFLETVGTTATIEHNLPKTLEAIALGLQRSQESCRAIQSWPSNAVEKDPLLQHSVPGFLEMALSSNGALNVLLKQRAKINDFLEVVDLLVSPQDNRLQLIDLCQEYCTAIAENFGESAQAVVIDEHVAAAQAELRQPQSSDKNAIVERLIAEITPADLFLDFEQQEDLTLMKEKLKKDFIAILDLENGILEQGLARIIIASVHDKKQPALETREHDSATPSNMAFVKTILHRLQQATPAQQSIVCDLVIAQLLPSVDERQQPSVHASAQEQSEVEAFNAQRSDEKIKLKSLMHKAIYYNNPQELLALLESAEIDVLRQPQHQSMLRVLVGFALYEAYGYSPEEITAERDQQIRAGLLDAPLSFQQKEWEKHLTVIQNAEPLTRPDFVERAISELLPHLNMLTDLGTVTGVKLEQARRLNALRSDQKETFKVSLLNLAQQPFSVSTNELAAQVFGLPVYDYYRTSKDWAVHEAMGTHFLDDLIHVTLNHSGLSSARILDIMRSCFSVPLNTSELLAQVADILLEVLGPTEEDRAAGVPCNRFMVKDFMQNNQAGLLRFMSKTLLKLCPPSDLPEHYAEKQDALAQLEEILTCSLGTIIGNSSQIEDISIGLVNFTLAIKNNDAQCLHQAAIKLSPTLAALLENIPSTDTSSVSHRVASYMHDIDSAIRSAVGFNGIPQLSTLSRYQRLGAHYGVGLNRVLPAATYAWKGYSWACNHATAGAWNFAEKALNQGKSLYACSVKKTTEATASAAAKCRETLNQTLGTVQEAALQTKSAVQTYCRNSLENVISLSQYSFNSAYKSLFSGAVTVKANEEEVLEADDGQSRSWPAALLFSAVTSFANLGLDLPKCRYR